MPATLGWRTYERIVAAVEAEHIGIEISVTPNARIRGAISGYTRQIDVLLDLRWSDDVSARTIVDAKLRRRKVDIKEVETFIGMMADCRASRGILVCSSGHTAAALARAQEVVTIRLLAPDDVDEFLWSSYEPCLGRCCDRVPAERRGLVLWDAQHVLPVDPGWDITFTGKCDVCHQFHVWCWNCGLRFAVPDERQLGCGCDGRLWASAIEQAEDNQLNAAHLLMVNECLDPSQGPVWLDRRALR
ncbi:restriction endonuclease [Roseomonas mucosa]|uniref:restriction endonuclease n=1 Tax=Roseomonas mucosa TaxID=207340 RepID=UPI0012397B36|nr:restriction endonuclease [Roseomonas mucosa]MBS5904727.1 restriction endonuclease [Acetobacteraceae bacterium]HWL81587.1 restriction endonuclease [Roseomonas sp.]MCG7354860.1 restriction endonuclease [Roseomonas mucosa]MDT8288396.1 restriction endonuclease [Roseomonas mucosa]MDT8313256.1 restriction endonuclease [Roseomonas mucosa]